VAPDPRRLRPPPSAARSIEFTKQRRCDPSDQATKTSEGRERALRRRTLAERFSGESSMAVGSSERLAERRIQITRGPLNRVLWRLIAPAAAWYVLSYAFFVADTYFVGRLGTSQLAAMGLISAVVMLTMTLAQGIGSALSAIAALFLGAGQDAPAARLISHTTWLGLIVSALLLVVGLPTIDPLFRALGATDDLMPHIRDYMVVWNIGYAIAIVPVVGQAGIRATGDVITPALILLLGGAINVALDPILIYGAGPIPAFGVRGAAVASLVGRAIGGVITFVVLARRDRLLKLCDFEGIRTSWSQILKIGLPVSLQMSVLALVAAINLRIASGLSATALAALGVGYRIEALATAFVFGLPVILPTFIGQNAGAGDKLRAGTGTLLAVRQVSFVQAGLAVALAFAASAVAVPFSKDATVQALIVAFLVWVPISYAAHAITAAAAGVFISLGRMRSYLILGALPSVLLVPMAWFGARLWGFSGLVGALSAARILLGAIAYVWLRRTLVQVGFVAADAPASYSSMRVT
jgi:putative MATE family efflux protein